MGRPWKCETQSLLKEILCGFIFGATLLAAGGRAQPAQQTTGEANLQRGRQAYKEARWGQALPLLQEAAKAAPANVEAWLFLASCLDRLGQPEQASKAFKQAIQANPNLVIVHIYSGVHYGRLRLDEKGMEARLKALNLEPDFAAAYHSIGLAYARLGRFPEAINAYREAIRIKPDCAEAYSNLAVAYHFQNKWGKALQCSREAVRLDTQNAEAHFNLGVCFLKMGNRAGALREKSALERLGSSLSDELYAAIKSGYTYPVAGSALRRPAEKD
jgi:tetratricopeptide (TPR) repeat protein